MRQPLDEHIKNQLDTYIVEIGKQLNNADTISIVGLIISKIDENIRDAIETKDPRSKTVAIVLHTPGGEVEIVERIVEVIREFYEEVVVIVPSHAMSAGTVFALSADRIMMDYFSRLGPIDPQIWKDGKLVPALSYLKQYEKLNMKAMENTLTVVEYGMLEKLDLGELYQFEQARELSVELLMKWLSQYKFKNWKKTETKKNLVSDEMKKERAKKIADKLNDPERWHSHGRGISMDTLRNELNLKIEDYSEKPELKDSIKNYFSLLTDYYSRENSFYFIHTKEYFDLWRI